MIELKGQYCKDVKIFTDNVEEIVKYIEPTVNILYFMKPMMNIKASDTKEEDE